MEARFHVPVQAGSWHRGAFCAIGSTCLRVKWLWCAIALPRQYSARVRERVVHCLHSVAEWDVKEEGSSC